MEEQQKQLTILVTFQQIKKELQTKYNKIEQAFNAIDINKSGSIEIDDFVSELTNFHGINDQDLMKSIFDTINYSKTGKIILEEFETLWTQVDREVISLQNKIELQKQVKPSEQDKQIKQSDQDELAKPQFQEKQLVQSFLSDEKGDRVSDVQYSTISPTRVTFDYHFVQPLDISKVQETRSIITPNRSQKLSYLATTILSPSKIMSKQSNFLNKTKQNNVNNNGNGPTKANIMKKDFNTYLAFVGLGQLPSQQSQQQFQQQRYSNDYSNQLQSKINQISQTYRTSPGLRDRNQEFIQSNFFRTKGVQQKPLKKQHQSLSRSPERYILENQALQHYMNKVNSKRSYLVQSLKSYRDKSSEIQRKPTRRSIF